MYMILVYTNNSFGKPIAMKHLKWSCPVRLYIKTFKIIENSDFKNAMDGPTFSLEKIYKYSWIFAKSWSFSVEEEEEDGEDGEEGGWDDDDAFGELFGEEDKRDASIASKLK